MLWFLPCGLLVGALCTQAALQRRQERRSLDWLLLLLIGWVPILAWIASQWVGQY